MILAYEKNAMKNYLKIILYIIAILFENCTCMQVNPEEFRTNIIGKNINIIAIKRFLQIGMNIFPFNNAKINEIFGKIEEKISENTDHWTLIVFSEYFFGEGNPLNNNEVNYIVGKCNELTNQYKKVVIHISFLHTFNIEDRHCPAWLTHNYTPISSIEIVNRMINTDQQNTPLAATIAITNRIANYSLVIWNNRPVSIYRKSTYCNEANSLINLLRTDITYEFGNFTTHSLIAEDCAHHQMANIFSEDIPLIVTRICADMNRKAFLTDQYLRQNGMLILPAKEAPTLGNMGTTTLQVDDTMRWNKYILLRNNGNITFVKPVNEVYPNSNYLGLCFALSGVPIDEKNKQHPANSYFSDGQHQVVVVESEDDDGCCCCCF